MLQTLQQKSSFPTKISDSTELPSQKNFFFDHKNGRRKCSIKIYFISEGQYVVGKAFQFRRKNKKIGGTFWRQYYFRQDFVSSVMIDLFPRGSWLCRKWFLNFEGNKVPSVMNKVFPTASDPWKYFSKLYYFYKNIMSKRRIEHRISNFSKLILPFFHRLLDDILLVY